MTSYELRLKIKGFLQNEENDYLLTTLKRTHEMFSMLTEVYNEFFINRANTKNYENEALKTISEIDLELKKVSPGKLIRQVDSLKTAFERLDFERIYALYYETNIDPDIQFHYASDNPSKFHFNNFQNFINAFEKEYEKFLAKPNVSNIFLLLKYGNTLYIIFISITFLLEDIFEQLDKVSKREITENEKVLSLFLQPGNNLEILISKLEALNIIYAELCRLFNVSTAEYPLKVIKVESGSLWIKLFGESKVITFMTDSLKEVASFLYRNFTNEGKLSSITNQIHGIEMTLNLESKMKESGFDTNEMRESIAKSAAVIARNQNILLSGESSVKINEDNFSVNSSIDKLIAERMQVHLLEGETDETKLLGDGNANED